LGFRHRRDRHGRGIFQKHNLELQTVYTSGGGETQQAVISGSRDIASRRHAGRARAPYAKGAPVRVIAGEATGPPSTIS